MNKSFWWLVVILIVVAIGGFYLKGSKTETPDNPDIATEEQLIPATGNVDDVANAILGELTGEELAPEEYDPSTLETDNAVLDGFDEAFDETQF